jgi:DNA-directed RNA polymerase subunit M/transcription elongation factor TFIIS
MMFKGCSRCGGNMYLEEEGRHRDLVCLQCGHRPPDTSRILEEMRHAARGEAARA